MSRAPAKAKIQCKDIPDERILSYLADYQGKWTMLWYGHFRDKDPSMPDVFYAFPEGTPRKVIFKKMEKLHRRGLVGGCPCGCRGDFEITDKGLELIGRERVEPYSGY